MAYEGEFEITIYESDYIITFFLLNLLKSNKALQVNCILFAFVIHWPKEIRFKDLTREIL